MTDKNDSKQQVHPQEFAAALVLLRDSLGVTNWHDFGHALKERAGIEIQVGTWQHLGPNYRRGGWPNSQVCFILELAGIFRFQNGEPVTSGKMLEIYAGLRDRFGNSIPKPATNGAGNAR